MTKQLSTKIVYQNPWMKVREDEVVFSNGHKGIYGVVEKDHFALIVPYDGHYFHLVKQYRYAIGEHSIEFPQGKHEDRLPIDLLDVASSELEEEIGLRARSLKKIGFFYEAAGYSNQGFHLFLATDLYKGTKKPDLTEADLLHIPMSLKEFEKSIISGSITDAPTISAYGLLKAKGIV